MNYEEKTDLELSVMVALACEKEVHHGISTDRVVIGVSGGMHGNYDLVYFSINNPADMWPIILENGISLIKFKSGYQAVSEGWNYIDVSNHCDINDCCIGADQFDCGHENAFRAAAIVFLMMKGVKQDERI